MCRPLRFAPKQGTLAFFYQDNNRRIGTRVMLFTAVGMGTGTHVPAVLRYGLGTAAVAVKVALVPCGHGPRIGEQSRLCTICRSGKCP